MKVKSNIISFLLGMLIMLPFGGYAATEIMAKSVNVPVLVDGQAVNTTVYNIADKNYTSARDIAEAMGGTVEWKDGKVQIETPKTPTENVAYKAKDSCVMIYVYKGGVQVGYGSGFAYNGYIVTAKHVLDMGDEYAVFTDDSTNGKRGYPVDISTNLDVAILSTVQSVPSVILGDSDKLKEGQKLVAITSPDKWKNAIDECIFSGFGYYDGAKILNISESETEGGSSGGAIFNTFGEIVGMNFGGIGTKNSAIPINDIKPILENLK